MTTRIPEEDPAVADPDDGGATVGGSSGPRGLLACLLPTSAGTVALGASVLVAALVLALAAGIDPTRASGSWLFGIGLALLPLAGVWWLLGHGVPLVVGRRRREGVEPVGLALREGALWSFWLGWVLVVLFQPAVPGATGGVGSPAVRVSVVALVALGVLGRGLRRDEADRLARGVGYGRGPLGTVLFVGSSVLLGLLTVASVFVLVLAIGVTHDAAVPGV